MQLLKIILLSFSFCFVVASWAEDLPNPEADNLANFHLKDEDCAGACHEKEEPSEELEFEESSCIECHDDFGKLEGKQHNIKHKDDESMTCIECHMPHEEDKPEELCADCHEPDHAAFDDLFKLKK
jgi:hypothetical protein